VDIKTASKPLKIKIANAWAGMKETITYMLSEAAKLKGVKTDAFIIIREKRDSVQLNIRELQSKTETLTLRTAELRQLQVYNTILQIIVSNC
jgi:hypothetical protein